MATPQSMSGGVLLSHRVAPAVPSALRVLASGFGMCPGVSLALWPPKLWYQHHPCVGVWWSRLHDPPGPTGVGGGCAGLCCVVCCVSVCWEPQSGREQSRATHSSLTNRVCVVIVKLSAY